jgi:hypothetical protein
MTVGERKIHEKVRKNRYAMRRRRVLYTQHALAKEVAEATGIPIDTINKVMDYSQAILWERLCQYDRAETNVGTIAIARNKSRKYEVRLQTAKELTLKVNVMMSELEE